MPDYKANNVRKLLVFKKLCIIILTEGYVQLILLSSSQMIIDRFLVALVLKQAVVHKTPPKI